MGGETDMTEWGVLGVIITVAGLLATVITPIINLTKSITKLTVVVENLAKDMESQRSSTKRLWEHNDEQDTRLNDHETRIQLLEKVE